MESLFKKKKLERKKGRGRDEREKEKWVECEFIEKGRAIF